MTAEVPAIPTWVRRLGGGAAEVARMFFWFITLIVVNFLISILKFVKCCLGIFMSLPPKGERLMDLEGLFDTPNRLVSQVVLFFCDHA